MLHDADVVVPYEIMNPYVPHMDIQADLYRPSKNGQCPGPESYFLLK